MSKKPKKNNEYNLIYLRKQKRWGIASSASSHVPIKSIRNKYLAQRLLDGMNRLGY